MADFECRWPSNEVEWSPIDAIAPQDAAELHAASICRGDNDCYSAFASGEEIQIRLSGSSVVVTCRVTCHFDPEFRASLVEIERR